MPTLSVDRDEFAQALKDAVEQGIGSLESRLLACRSDISKDLPQSLPAIDAICAYFFETLGLDTLLWKTSNERWIEIFFQNDANFHSIRIPCNEFRSRLLQAKEFKSYSLPPFVCTYIRKTDGQEEKRAAHLVEILDSLITSKGPQDIEQLCSAYLDKMAPFSLGGNWWQSQLSQLRSDSQAESENFLEIAFTQDDLPASISIKKRELLSVMERAQNRNTPSLPVYCQCRFNNQLTYPRYLLLPEVLKKWQESQQSAAATAEAERPPEEIVGPKEPLSLSAPQESDELSKEREKEAIDPTPSKNVVALASKLSQSSILERCLEKLKQSPTTDFMMPRISNPGMSMGWIQPDVVALLLQEKFGSEQTGRLQHVFECYFYVDELGKLVKKPFRLTGSEILQRCFPQEIGLEDCAQLLMPLVDKHTGSDFNCRFGFKDTDITGFEIAVSGNKLLEIVNKAKNQGFESLRQDPSISVSQIKDGSFSSSTHLFPLVLLEEVCYRDRGLDESCRMQTEAFVPHAPTSWNPRWYALEATLKSELSQQQGEPLCIPLLQNGHYRASSVLVDRKELLDIMNDPARHEGSIPCKYLWDDGREPVQSFILVRDFLKKWEELLTPSALQKHSEKTLSPDIVQLSFASSFSLDPSERKRIADLCREKLALSPTSSFVLPCLSHSGLPVKWVAPSDLENLLTVFEQEGMTALEEMQTKTYFFSTEFGSIKSKEELQPAHKVLQQCFPKEIWLDQCLQSVQAQLAKPGSAEILLAAPLDHDIYQEMQVPGKELQQVLIAAKENWHAFLLNSNTITCTYLLRSSEGTFQRVSVERTPLQVFEQFYSCTSSHCLSILLSSVIDQCPKPNSAWWKEQVDNLERASNGSLYLPLPENGDYSASSIWVDGLHEILFQAASDKNYLGVSIPCTYRFPNAAEVSGRILLADVLRKWQNAPQAQIIPKIVAAPPLTLRAIREQFEQTPSETLKLQPAKSGFYSSASSSNLNPHAYYYNNHNFSWNSEALERDVTANLGHISTLSGQTFSTYDQLISLFFTENTAKNPTGKIHLTNQMGDLCWLSINAARLCQQNLEEKLPKKFILNAAAPARTTILSNPKELLQVRIEQPFALTDPVTQESIQVQIALIRTGRYSLTREIHLLRDRIEEQASSLEETRHGHIWGAAPVPSQSGPSVPISTLVEQHTTLPPQHPEPMSGSFVSVDGEAMEVQPQGWRSFLMAGAHDLIVGACNLTGNTFNYLYSKVEIGVGTVRQNSQSLLQWLGREIWQSTHLMRDNKYHLALNSQFEALEEWVAKKVTDGIVCYNNTPEDFFLNLKRAHQGTPVDPPYTQLLDIASCAHSPLVGFLVTALDELIHETKAPGDLKSIRTRNAAYLASLRNAKDTPDYIPIPREGSNPTFVFLSDLICTLSAKKMTHNVMTNYEDSLIKYLTGGGLPLNDPNQLIPHDDLKRLLTQDTISIAIHLGNERLHGNPNLSAFNQNYREVYKPFSAGLIQKLLTSLGLNDQMGTSNVPEVRSKYQVQFEGGQPWWITRLRHGSPTARKDALQFHGNTSIAPEYLSFLDVAQRDRKRVLYVNLQIIEETNPLHIEPYLESLRARTIQDLETKYPGTFYFLSLPANGDSRVWSETFFNAHTQDWKQALISCVIGQQEGYRLPAQCKIEESDLLQMATDLQKFYFGEGEFNYSKYQIFLSIFHSYLKESVVMRRGIDYVNSTCKEAKDRGNASAAIDEAILNLRCGKENDPSALYDLYIRVLSPVIIKLEKILTRRLQPLLDLLEHLKNLSNEQKTEIARYRPPIGSNNAYEILKQEVPREPLALAIPLKAMQFNSLDEFLREIVDKNAVSVQLPAFQSGLISGQDREQGYYDPQIKKWNMRKFLQELDLSIQSSEMTVNGKQIKTLQDLLPPSFFEHANNETLEMGKQELEWLKFYACLSGRSLLPIVDSQWQIPGLEICTAGLKKWLQKTPYAHAEVRSVSEPFITAKGVDASNWSVMVQQECEIARDGEATRITVIASMTPSGTEVSFRYADLSGSET